jgi:hypothetical protein
MIIFLGNIPSETKKYEIANFIEGIFNDCFLDKPSTNISLEDIKIFSILDVHSNTLEHHCLVMVSPNEVGKRLVKKLEGMFFKGKHITSHEYVYRSMNNDPRNQLFADTANAFTERRVSDRRREPVMNSWQRDPILVQRKVSYLAG